MNILLVAATFKELELILEALPLLGHKIGLNIYEVNNHIVHILVTGVGGVQTVFSICTFEAIKNIDLSINIGIAGSFNNKIGIGTVVKIKDDCFADIGIEEKDGQFKDIFELDFQDKNQFPFENGSLKPLRTENLFENLINAKSITVNKTSGTKATIRAIMDRYDSDIESMEGASFYYSMRRLEIPCIQIRSISNMVEPRNRNSWNIDLALKNLSDTIIHFLMNLKETHS